MCVTKINQTYTQRGNICVLASYAIIIEYFSNGEMPVNVLFENYYRILKNTETVTIPELSSAKKTDEQLEMENTISDYFHDYCRSNGDIRGFEYIVDIHVKDTLETNKYCKIVGTNAQKEVIDEKEKLLLRDSLISGGLAMVLYPTSAEGVLHSIIIGYDQVLESCFKRDPANGNIEFEDFLQNNSITEYIHFIAE